MVLSIKGSVVSLEYRSTMTGIFVGNFSRVSELSASRAVNERRCLKGLRGVVIVVGLVSSDILVGVVVVVVVGVILGDVVVVVAVVVVVVGGGAVKVLCRLGVGRFFWSYANSMW